MVRAADGTLRVDGATIHFKTAGRGPVLLLLPGGDGDAANAACESVQAALMAGGLDGGHADRQCWAGIRCHLDEHDGDERSGCVGYFAWMCMRPVCGSKNPRGAIIALSMLSVDKFQMSPWSLITRASMFMIQ